MQREASPTACVIDSQSGEKMYREKAAATLIRTATTQARRSRARSVISSSIRLALVLHAIVHPADIQERDGGILLISTLFGRFPFLRKMFADGGIRGHNSSRRSHVCFRSSTSRSSSDPMRRAGSRCCHAMGRRTDVRLAQPLPPPVQGFRESDPKRTGFSPPCVDPAHATKGL